jgi:methionyl-tRNA formyltransferase
VRTAAQAAGLPVLTDVPRGPEFLARLRDLAVDAVAVVAYGHLIRPDMLAVPRIGWINLHFSLLPAWRGAAPVQRAIIAGDEITGATTFVLDAGMDTGPVLGTMTETIRTRDTSGDLLGRLAQAGAGLLVATFDALDAGSIAVQPQVGEVSLAPKLSTADAFVSFRSPALAVDRLVRGCTPAPGAWTSLPAFRAPGGASVGGAKSRTSTSASRAPRGASVGDAKLPSFISDGGGRLGLGPVRLRPDITDVAPGEIRAGKQEVVVGTLTHAVELGEVRPVGKPAMRAADWARGARLPGGARLGDVARLGDGVAR